MYLYTVIDLRSESSAVMIYFAMLLFYLGIYFPLNNELLSNNTT